MAEDTDNLTLKLLQKIQGDIQGLHSRFDAVDERLDNVEAQLGGLTHVVLLLANNAGIHEERLDKLEAKSG